MRNTRLNRNKPDFLAVLVALVAVGVLVSATLQAQATDSTSKRVDTAVQLDKAQVLVSSLR